jgi:hypothetical protein
MSAADSINVTPVHVADLLAEGELMPAIKRELEEALPKPSGSTVS